MAASTVEWMTPVEAEVKVGMVFYTSWGYDQTNVDFYQVVEVTPKGVKVRQVGSRSVGTEGSCDYVVPGKGFIGEPMFKRLRKDHNGKPAFRVASYASAYLWDGSMKYQTAAGWGH